MKIVGIMCSQHRQHNVLATPPEMAQRLLLLAYPNLSNMQGAALVAVRILRDQEIPLHPHRMQTDLTLLPLYRIRASES